MDLRRGGEFAFGSAVFSCGGLFLALAAGRLSAPVTGAGVGAVPVVAVAAVAQPANGRIAQHRRVMQPATQGPDSKARVPRFARASVAHALQAKPPVHRTSPLAVSRQALVLRVLHPNAATLAQRPKLDAKAHARARASVAAHVAKTKSLPRIAARPSARRRERIAYVPHIRRPRAERTPEPPIGYDDRPVLLRTEGPAEPPPAIAPVQVEIVTTHLAH